MRADRPELERSAREGDGCLLPLLFAVLAIAGAFVLWAFFYEPYAMFFAAQRWQRTPCAIVASEITPVTAASQGKHVRERLDFRYRYTYDGKRYHAARIWFVKPDTDAVQQIPKRYPRGMATVCYVNPDDPAQALLERDFRPQLLIAIFPLALTLLGLTGLASQALAHLRRRPQTLPHLSRWAQPRPPAAPPRLRTTREGTLVYRGKRGLAPMLFFFAIAIIWNGAIFFLLREVFDIWSDGVPGCHGWFLSLVALPFVVAGIGLIAGAGYSLLKLFNPRPTLVISAATVPLGGHLDVRWTFTGKAQRMRRLLVTLEGREEATYTRGTSTVTDREVFATVTLADTTRTSEILAGAARGAVPLASVPTFRSAHNRIAWAVHITGDIPHWPDVDDEVEIEVTPASPAAPSEVAS